MWASLPSTPLGRDIAAGLFINVQKAVHTPGNVRARSWQGPFPSSEWK